MQIPEIYNIPVLHSFIQHTNYGHSFHICHSQRSSKSSHVCFTPLWNATLPSTIGILLQHYVTELP